MQESHARGMLTSLQSQSVENRSMITGMQPSIMELYSSLHQTINEMDYKVEHVIKKHQTQFLLAYQNHISKIKKELAQIKHKSEEQEKMFNSNDRIQYLEREMVVFREEAIRLYARLQYGKEERDRLMDKCKEMEKALGMKEREGKEAMRASKIQEVKRGKLLDRIEELEREISLKDAEIMKLKEGRRVEVISLKSEDLPTLQSPLQPQSTKMSPTKQSMSFIRQLPQSQSMRSSKYNPINLTSFNLKRIGRGEGPSPSMLTPSDFQLKDWFLSCIKVVKKEISHRNPSSVSPFALDSIHSLDDFTTIDKLRVLQMFVSNEKLLAWMYGRIFPERMDQVRAKLSGGGNNPNPNPNLNPNPNPNVNPRNKSSLEVQQESSRSMTQRYPILPHVRNSKQQLRNSVIIKNGKLNISVS